MTTLYWCTAAASITGVLLNIHGRRLSYAIWACTNAIWAVADLTHDLPQQAAMQTVYFALSLYGLWRWSRTPRPGTSSA